jgi:hypothetical protein
LVVGATKRRRRRERKTWIHRRRLDLEMIERHRTVETIVIDDDEDDEDGEDGEDESEEGGASEMDEDPFTPLPAPAEVTAPWSCSRTLTDFGNCPKSVLNRTDSRTLGQHCRIGERSVGGSRYRHDDDDDGTATGEQIPQWKVGGAGAGGELLKLLRREASSRCGCEEGLALLANIVELAKGRLVAAGTATTTTTTGPRPIENGKQLIAYLEASSSITIVSTSSSSFPFPFPLPFTPLPAPAEVTAPWSCSRTLTDFGNCPKSDDDEDDEDGEDGEDESEEGGASEMDEDDASGGGTPSQLPPR